MARNRIHIKARPEDVFEVLLDPRSYAYWVVGAKEARDVDSSWPAEGAALHHSMGAAAATVEDRTEIVELRRPQVLKLRAHARPLGVADVTISARSRPDGCVVVIEERPARDTKAAKIAPLLSPLVYLRNVWSLQRLKKLVLRRASR